MHLHMKRDKKCRERYGSDTGYLLYNFTKKDFYAIMGGSEKQNVRKQRMINI